jgi:hypothetical protein
MDNEQVAAAKQRVARRAALREQAARHAQTLPDEYRRSLRSQFEQGRREAQLITRLNQGRSLQD